MKTNNDLVTIQLKGGLGNMLFQIATAFSLSLRDGKSFVCDRNMSIIPHKHFSYYTPNILKNVRFEDTTNVNFTYIERGFSFDEVPNFEGNVRLSGYFQSEKYFKKYRTEVLKLFEVDTETRKKIYLFLEKLDKEKVCSVHIRRGDYLTNQNFHILQEIKYYKEAINKIGNDFTFLVFSDDLNWCKNNLDFIEKKIFVEGLNDYEELYLMSNCVHNIITNSTFSWWGAWMNENPTKIVISPKEWFGVSNKHLNTKDLYCEDWIIL